MSYSVVNLSHRFTDEQLGDLVELVGSEPTQVVEIAVHFESTRTFDEQAFELLDRLADEGVEVETATIVWNLPAHSFIASLVLAIIHGRYGSFPSVIQIGRTDGIVSRWAIIGITNLQQVRDESRSRRLAGPDA